MRLTKISHLAISISVPCVLVSIYLIAFQMKSENPKVVLLYTQNEVYPDLAFKVSSIPLAIASALKMGLSKFATLPATYENLETTLNKAEFIVVGAHGDEGGVITDEGFYFGPGGKVNGNVRHIYFGSCYFGQKRALWQRRFPNARLIGYESLTYPMTGWRYLFLESWIDLLKL